MKKLWFFLACVLIAGVSSAQIPADDVNFSPSCRVSELNTGCVGGPEPSRTAWVVDAVSSSDCTVGGAVSTVAVPHTCERQSDGTWAALGSGGAALPTCANALYSNTNPVDSQVGIAQLDDSGGAAGTREIMPAATADITEISDPLGVWAKQAGVSSYLFSGTDPITVRLRANAVFNLGSLTGLFQYLTAFQDEGVIAADDERSNGFSTGANGIYTATIVDEIAVDQGDGIGHVIQLLNAIGYVDVTVITTTIEISQVAPPCVSDEN